MSWRTVTLPSGQVLAAHYADPVAVWDGADLAAWWPSSSLPTCCTLDGCPVSYSDAQAALARARAGDDQ